jgi:quinol monooxygenase YgiN
MEMPMIVSSVRMTIPPQKRDAALKIFRSTAARCRGHHGCLSCRIYEDMQDQNVLMIETAWRADADLKHYLCSGEYREQLTVLEMALQPPEISFDTISHSSGIETIEKARSNTGKIFGEV